VNGDSDVFAGCSRVDLKQPEFSTLKRPNFKAQASRHDFKRGNGVRRIPKNPKEKERRIQKIVAILSNSS
jgi:hypothetical protein